MPITQTAPGPRSRAATALFLPFMLLASILALSVHAESADAASYRITNTGGIGVRQRHNPTIASSYSGVAPEGAWFNVECQTWSEPVGNYANRLWLKVNRSGVGFSFWIADTYTTSPRTAAGPALAGIPMCSGTTTPTTPPAVAGRPSLQMPFECNTTWTATTYDTGEEIVNGRVVRSWSHRNQLDFGQAGAAGQPVRASAGGHARVVNRSQGSVLVDHGGGWSTFYSHLSDFTVDENGRNVAAGEMIARIGHGRVGTSTGPHLHYEQRQNGAAVEPMFTSGTFTWSPGRTVTVGSYRFTNDRASTNSLRSTNGCVATPPAPAVSRYSGHIVQWNGDTKPQKTAWLVMPDLTRLWIPDAATYNALKRLGAPGPTVLPAAELDQLRDRTGQRAHADHLSSGWTVGRGTTIWSSSNGYALIFQHDGNLVLYAPGSRAIWASYAMSATRLVMQTDGNLVLYNAANQAVWSSGTSGHGRGRLIMQADGNLVIYRADGRAVWATHTYGGTNRLNNPAGFRL